jgi:hypothetical protein
VATSLVARRPITCFVCHARGIVVADPSARFETDGYLMLLVPIAFEAFLQLLLTDLKGTTFVVVREIDSRCVITSKYASKPLSPKYGDDTAPAPAPV